MQGRKCPNNGYGTKKLRKRAEIVTYFWRRKHFVAKLYYDGGIRNYDQKPFVRRDSGTEWTFLCTGRSRILPTDTDIGTMRSSTEETGVSHT
ncbi:hypothetical protein TNCV_3195301 [Trichonephila clavipes]|uniref:Uncharacterized protein n=1 Tax=Trichonephila clavipes TaxID=2585209 RepID=A0A8X6RDS5_TRICX|nr:hypothetical protein TNCV_3195301 [Trichonephila clavipes]